MFEFLKHITLRTKILALFIVLILLPAAVICYLGLKSVREKTENQRIIYIGTANLIRDKLENQIYQLENSYRNRTTELLSGAESGQTVQERLRAIEKENPEFKNLFLVSNEGTLTSALMTFGKESRGIQPQEPDPAARTIFSSAENAEFIKRNPGLAISYYRSALTASSSSFSRALVLSRLGRCYIKTGAYENAIHSYERIIHLPDPEIPIGRIPATVVAYTQMSDCYRALNADRERYMTLLQGYRYLLESPWDPADGEYTYYLNSFSRELQGLQDSLRSALSDLVPPVDEMEKWKHLELHLRENMEVLKGASKFMVPDLLPADTPWRSGEIEHLAQKISPDSTFRLSYFSLPGSVVPGNITTAAFQINVYYLLEHMFPETLSSVELGKDIVAGILNLNDSLLYPVTDAHLSGYLAVRAFDRYIPEWRVALFDHSGKTLEQLENREKRLYFSLFLGVLAIMLIGISVLARAVIHETEISRLKSEFVSNVTHELKTPLTLIRMFGETLNSGIVKDEARQKEYFAIISQESERLTHLINNVLDFSNIDKGKKDYSFERTDLVALVTYSLEAYKFHIRNMGFEIESDLPSEPVYLVIDKDAISQALLNLLSNSVKYSADQKYIRVQVSPEPDSVWISVIDHGVGIPKEEQKRIFDKFYRIPGRNGTGSKGSGLGLTLTKYIVNAHGGTVEVESVPGKGSQFTIILPR